MVKDQMVEVEKGTLDTMEVTTFNRSFGDAADFPIWDKIGATFRLSCIYGAMALAGNFICSLSGGEVVKVSPHARAIIDFILVVAASSVVEELFYRAAVQDRGSDLVTDARGMPALIAASPKDPTYVVATVLQSCSGREDLKKLLASWSCE
ncbi:Mannonate dehydratase [Bienertia sinuspersici]